MREAGKANNARLNPSSAISHAVVIVCVALSFIDLVCVSSALVVVFGVPTAKSVHHSLKNPRLIILIKLLVLSTMKISAASLAFLFAGASMASAQNIVGVATDNGFTTLLAAVGAADESIATTLATVSPLTVFAPTNEAFDALPFGLVNCLTTIPENQAALNSILQYHVVAANATADSLMDGQVVDTLLTGESITVNLTDGVQIIDGTMMPANVGPADVFADNGVVHVIDKVLLPASLDVTAFMQDSCPDIPETATANGNFEVLLQAVGAADLAAALSFPNGPLTVFAPTDAAFDTVPESIRNCLLKPENKETLVSLLTYHVVEGAVASTDIPATPVRTLQGGDLEFDTMDGVTIDGGLTGTVTVVQADIGKQLLTE